MCHQKMQKFLYISIVHGAHYVPNIKVDPYYLSKVFIGWNAEKKDQRIGLKSFGLLSDHVQGTEEM